MTNKIRAIGAAVLVVLWAVLTGLAWFSPAEESSVSERRPLAQFPELSTDTILNGKFMTNFEDYTLDQFPFRDPFRQLKSLTHYYVLRQKDNNDIYLVDGYAAKLDYPVNTPAVEHALNRINYVYETYLKEQGSKVYMSVIPDKGYYLAEANGYPAMDYPVLFDMVKKQLPFATHIDITHCLSAQDYYFTDTHWRQEALLPTAQKLSSAMGLTAPKTEDFTKAEIDRPFYGVYYGQAALPLQPETMYIMESQLLKDCQVYNFETRKYTPVYDMDKVSGKDPYDVYLSGAQSLLRIENPNAATDKELIVFRDSFGSSLVPLLVQDYKTVTLVDIRYLDSRILNKYLEFSGQDVLFLYSTLVLNSGTTLK